MQKSTLKDWDRSDSESEDEMVPDFVKNGEEDLDDAKEYDENVEKMEKKREMEERMERKKGGKKRKK